MFVFFPFEDISVQGHAYGWYRPKRRLLIVCGVLPADLSVEDVEAKLLGVRSVEGAAELYMSLERLGDSSPASSREEDGTPVLDLSERCSPSLTEMKDWQYLTYPVSQHAS